MASNDSGLDVLAGFLLGAVAGAALALLMAPQAGEETRRQLKERGIELQGKAQDVADQAKTQAGSLSDKAKLQANELSMRAREQADQLTSRGRMAFEEGSARFEEAMAEGKKAGQAKQRELTDRLENERNNAGI